MMFDMLFAEIIHQESGHNIVYILGVSAILQCFDQAILMRGTKRCIYPILNKVLILNHFPKIGFVGGQTLDDEFLQGTTCGFDGTLTVFRMTSQLGNHRVVGF